MKLIQLNVGYGKVGAVRVMAHFMLGNAIFEHTEHRGLFIMVRYLSECSCFINATILHALTQIIFISEGTKRILVMFGKDTERKCGNFRQQKESSIGVQY